MTRRSISILLVAALLLWAPGVRAAWSGPNAREKAVMAAVKKEKLIHARELAEKLLRQHPDSFVGHFALGVVYHDEEANLPRALYQMRRAEKLLIAQLGAPPDGAVARTWHARMIEEEATLLGEMDRRKEQLATMDRHDLHYRPKMDRWRIWPLLKLGRFAEALKLARKVSASSDLNTRITGLNGRIAIESERHRPKACYDIGMAAVAATSRRSCILDQNTAEAAFAVFRFSDVERLAMASIKAPIQDCPSSAYPHLANLYLLKADFPRAMEAIRSSRGAPVEKRYRQQFEMTNTAWLGRLVYTLGKFKAALDLSRRVLRAPDRVGMTSFSDDVMKVIFTLDYHAALWANMEDLRERASVRSLLQGMALYPGLVELGRKAWVVRRKITRLLSRSNTLAVLVRPYLKPLPPWHAGCLLRVTGQGVLRAAVDQARARDKLAGSRAYYDALLCEAARADGEPATTLKLGTSALAGLPREEKLLRGRVSVMAGEAAYRLGKLRRAEELFGRGLSAFPTAFRLLGVRLPVTIMTGKSPAAREAGERLRGSRRLLMDGRLGFVVRVTDHDSALRICLESRGGRRVACADPRAKRQKARARRGGRHSATHDPSAPTTREERVLEALDMFHRDVFSPRVDLTQWDINSLDGSAIKGDADDVLKGVLRH